MANSSVFPTLLGAPTELDFVLPTICSNCGADRDLTVRQIHLWRARYGLRLKGAEFLMNVPICKPCAASGVCDPVAVTAINRTWLGKVRKIFLHCANHDFAVAFKAANEGLIGSGWLGVTDGGAGV